MNKFKKIGINASLAAFAVGSLTLIGGTQVANAAINPTCDASVLTVHLTDSTSGAPLANATYEFTTSGNVFVKAGNAMTDQAAFRAAYDGPTSTLGQASAQAFADHLSAGTQDTLGTNPVVYPDNFAGFTDPVAQQLAVTEFENSQKWADFKADAAARLAGINDTFWKVSGTAGYGASVDPEYDAALNEARNKAIALNNIINNLSNELARHDETGYNNAVNIYNQLVDPANWVYGISHDPSQQVIDLVHKQYDGADTTADRASANAEAAAAVGATQTVTVVTDGNGDAVVTTFGVKDGVYQGGTRGDQTCSQQTSGTTETQQPVGYHPNYVGTPYTVQSDDTASGRLDLVNDPITDVDLTDGGDTPDAPIKTSTGI
jgi:hypothetical protein